MKIGWKHFPIIGFCLWWVIYLAASVHQPIKEYPVGETYGWGTFVTGVLIVGTAVYLTAFALKKDD